MSTDPKAWALSTERSGTICVSSCVELPQCLTLLIASSPNGRDLDAVRVHISADAVASLGAWLSAWAKEHEPK